MNRITVEELQKLFALTNDIFLILDGKRSVLYASDGIKTLGYSEDDIIGLNFYNLVAGHVKPIVEKRFSEVSNRIVFNQRIILRSKENFYYTFICNFFVAWDRVFVFMRREESIDLSDLSVVNYLDFGLIIVDLNFRIVYHNSYVSNYFQTKGFTHLNQIPFGFGQKLAERIKFGQRNMEMEYHSGRILGINVYPLEIADFNGFLIKMKDITEGKKFEKGSSVGGYFSYVDLVSIYTHHIKNLLTPLKFTALSLKRDLNDAKQVEKIDRMISQIEKINHQVKAFYSKVKTKPIEFKKVSIKKVIDKVRHLMNNEFVSNGIVFEFSPNEDLNLYVDEDHLHQILSDLIQNALDAMKNQKGVRKLTIGVKKSDVRCPYCGAGFVEVDISDSGPGISKENLDRIFNLGFSTKADGWGLGLYVVEKMVKENRGIINVYSEVGKGTTFVLYFHPYTPEAMGCIEKQFKEV